MKKVLITGATGFIGSHLVEHLLKNTDWEIVILDRLDTASNPNRLVTMDNWDTFKSRVKLVFWDLKSEINSLISQQLGGPFDYIFHLAAGSHVDRSITDPMSFFMDNCIGTVNMLLYARYGGLKQVSDGAGQEVDVLPVEYAGKFLYFSTDEVFGPAPMTEEFTGYKEWDRANPNNPYAAAKSAAEMACIAFANTYRMPIVITNTMNVYGERQHPERFVPLVIKKVLNGEKVTIHSTKDKKQAGKRHYLHARNICAAALWVMENGKTLDGSAHQGRYNIVGEKEVDNLSMAQLIEKFVHEWQTEQNNLSDADKLKGPVHLITPLNYEMVDFHSSRPGHDLRYALDGSLLAEEGFSYPVSFEESLRKMVRWTLEHQNWL